ASWSSPRTPRRWPARSRISSLTTSCATAAAAPARPPSASGSTPRQWPARRPRCWNAISPPLHSPHDNEGEEHADEAAQKAEQGSGGETGPDGRRVGEQVPRF